MNIGKRLALLAALLTGSAAFHVGPVNAQLSTTLLMPVPASMRVEAGRLPVTEGFAVAVAGHNDARLQGGIERMLRRMEARAGLAFPREAAADAAKASLLIRCAGPGQTVPSLAEDESYSLIITPTQAQLSAPTVVGALRGLETLLQLLDRSRNGAFLPAVSIEDRPRFPWRGLMIDIGRRWQPMEVLKRNLDGMAAVKLNVLHLHITEDQGFRIESKKFPELHRMGSDGNFYTQDQMREIIEYARMRGIRVVPEFDLPGHTTSWFVSHPELASKPGPYQIERKWGIFEPVLDPSNERVYELLDGFLGEMAALFPDEFMHIGGDEVEAHHWKESAKIQAFAKEKGITDNHGLQAYFNKRVAAILTRAGKRVIGWDEVLHPDLPNNIVIQSWRGPKSLAEAAKKGYRGILSNGYYIDLGYSTKDHYLNDPIPADTPLTAEEQRLILGGEATMWSEWTSPEVIDSRIWPRMAAIAERLWSPASVRDVDEMYRRLPAISVQLEDCGLLHQKNPAAMLRRWLGPDLGSDEMSVRHAKKIIDLLEPVKGYTRGRMQTATQFTPMTRLVDISHPDSDAGRAFAELVENWLYLEPFQSRMSKLLAIEIENQLQDLGASAMVVSFSPGGEPRYPAEILRLAEDVKESCEIGRAAVAALQASAGAPAPEWRASSLASLARAATPKAAVELVLVPPIRELVHAAAERDKRATMTPEEWKKHIKALAAPPAKRQ